MHVVLENILNLILDYRCSTLHASISAWALLQGIHQFSHLIV
jgi:hypothetical protein